MSMEESVHGGRSEVVSRRHRWWHGELAQEV